MFAGNIQSPWCFFGGHPVYDYDEDVKSFRGAHECVALAMYSSAPLKHHPSSPLPQRVLLLPLGLRLLLVLLVF